MESLSDLVLTTRNTGDIRALVTRFSIMEAQMASRVLKRSWIVESVSSRNCFSLHVTTITGQTGRSRSKCKVKLLTQSCKRFLASLSRVRRLRWTRTTKKDDRERRAHDLEELELSARRTRPRELQDDQRRNLIVVVLISILLTAVEEPVETSYDSYEKIMRRFEDRSGRVEQSRAE